VKEEVGVGIKEIEIKAESWRQRDLHCTRGKFCWACGGWYHVLPPYTFLCRVRFYSSCNSLTVW